MLVLSRKTNESIMIGDDIEVSIIEITGKSIKLGIEAPKNIPLKNIKTSDQSKLKAKKLISNSPH